MTKNRNDCLCFQIVTQDTYELQEEKAKKRKSENI